MEHKLSELDTLIMVRKALDSWISRDLSAGACLTVVRMLVNTATKSDGSLRAAIAGGLCSVERPSSPTATGKGTHNEKR